MLRARLAQQLGWALVAIMIACPDATAQATEVVLHDFIPSPRGGTPTGGMILDPAGTLYGTTGQGGRWDGGVVYSLDPSGHETVLYSFTGGTDGFYPVAGVIRDDQGNLYGTTQQGGASNAGVVYKLDPTGHETVLHSFVPRAGRGPLGGLIRDSAGNLYGTTQKGGPAGAGLVYKLDPAGHYTVLHTFAYNGVDGHSPEAGVIRDAEGNLYGTTARGGPWDWGVVYKLDQSGNETVLYSFTGGTDGRVPTGSLVRDPSGNIYGTTSNGDPSYYGGVYKVDPSGHETVVYGFTGQPDGAYPQAGVIRDSDGNLYGTTYSGGASNAGVVFKLDSSGHETVLYNFARGADGVGPFAGLIRDSVGNFYGTTPGGSPSNMGVVYKLDASGHETVICNFTGGAAGTTPNAGVTRDSEGSFYGTTTGGGRGDAGVVYKVDSAGWYTVLYSFMGGADGSQPRAGVIHDSEGNLYGTTYQGGSSGAGVVFKLDPAGHETVLHSFTGADGANPEARLIRDSVGNLYGTTTSGGGSAKGLVYKLDPAGKLTVLHKFHGADGANPRAGLHPDTEGNFYGTTSGGGTANQGVVYKLDPAGHETVLHNFTGGADGGYPLAGLIRDTEGNFYGTTSQGGGGAGTVYKLDPAGHETVLHSFTGVDGDGPSAGVIRDSAGNLYGTTYFGGASNVGVVFRLDPSGHLTVLHNFTGGADGSYPYKGLTFGAAGSLVGTTFSGGIIIGGGVGVLFEIKGAAAY